MRALVILTACVGLFGCNGYTKFYRGIEPGLYPRSTEVTALPYAEFDLGASGIELGRSSFVGPPGDWEQQAKRVGANVVFLWQKYSHSRYGTTSIYYPTIGHGSGHTSYNLHSIEVYEQAAIFVWNPAYPGLRTPCERGSRPRLNYRHGYDRRRRRRYVD